VEEESGMPNSKSQNGEVDQTINGLEESSRCDHDQSILHLHSF
jgi:hypothetical protein